MCLFYRCRVTAESELVGSSRSETANTRADHECGYQCADAAQHVDNAAATKVEEAADFEPSSRVPGPTCCHRVHNAREEKGVDEEGGQIDSLGRGATGKRN